MSYWIKQNKGDIPTISGKIFEKVLVRRMLLKRHDFERWDSFQELRAIDIPMAYFMRVPCTLIRLLISFLVQPSTDNAVVSHDLFNKQVCVQPRASAVNATRPVFAAERRRLLQQTRRV